MQDMIDDLTGNTLTSRSKIINHPEYAKPVLMVQYGWTDGKHTVWNKDVEIKELPCQ